MWEYIITKITKHFRSVRWEYVKNIYPDIIDYKVIDVGGSINFWGILDALPKKVDIYNIQNDAINEFSKKLPKNISPFLFDGKKLPVDSDSYDLCICNSVIEHISTALRQDFINELLRVSKRLYLQTPSKYSLIEPHFLFPLLQWFPLKMGYLIAHISPWRILSIANNRTVKNYFYNTKLLTREELRSFFPTSIEIITERILYTPKSYMVFYEKN